MGPRQSVGDSLLDYRTPQSPAQGGNMSALSRDAIRTMMAEVLQAQGKPMPEDDAANLETIGFRSLDFSELALRVEDEIGDELNFDAPELRQIATISDVLDFLEQLQAACLRELAASPAPPTGSSPAASTAAATSASRWSCRLRRPSRSGTTTTPHAPCGQPRRVTS